MRHLSLDPRCPRCFMKPVLCLCAAFTARPTRSHLRIIVPEMELKKSTNSGRLLPLLLSNAALVPYGSEHKTLPPSPWPSSTRPLVIFPLQGAPLLSEFCDLSSGRPSAARLGGRQGADRPQGAVSTSGPQDAIDVDNRPWTLILLDGTWHQANRLRKRFLTSHVPFARLPVDLRPSTYQLRQGHFTGSLSTLEAAARALAIVEDDVDVEAHLLDGFRRMVDRTLWLRGSKQAADVYGGLPAGITRHDVNRALRAGG